MSINPTGGRVMQGSVRKGGRDAGPGSITGLWLATGGLALVVASAVACTSPGGSTVSQATTSGSAAAMPAAASSLEQ